MRLDLSPLENAIAQLREALKTYDVFIHPDHPHHRLTIVSTRAVSEYDLGRAVSLLQIQKQLRAGAIQAFEYTYELSVKMLRRHLALGAANPSEIAAFDFAELIREGIKRGLVVSDLAAWREYRRKRGTTSHVYDEDKAQEVFDGIHSFLDEARYLLRQLQKRHTS